MMAGVVKMVVKNETSSKSLQVSSIKARLIDWAALKQECVLALVILKYPSHCYAGLQQKAIC